MTFIDLFAGIGGFHYAFNSIGAKCVFASEWDKYARITYEENFKEIDPTFEFITEEDLEECKKEDPSFELTEEDLREALAHRKLLPEIEKIAQIDVNAKDDKV